MKNIWCALALIPLLGLADDNRIDLLSKHLDEAHKKHEVLFEKLKETLNKLEKTPATTLSSPFAKRLKIIQDITNTETFQIFWSRAISIRDDYKLEITETKTGPSARALEDETKQALKDLAEFLVFSLLPKSEKDPHSFLAINESSEILKEEISAYSMDLRGNSSTHSLLRSDIGTFKISIADRASAEKMYARGALSFFTFKDEWGFNDSMTRITEIIEIEEGKLPGSFDLTFARIIDEGSEFRGLNFPSSILFEEITFNSLEPSALILNSKTRRLGHGNFAKNIRNRAQSELNLKLQSEADKLDSEISKLNREILAIDTRIQALSK